MTAAPRDGDRTGPRNPRPGPPGDASGRSADPSLRIRAGTAADTVADDHAMTFLDELDESLWVLGEIRHSDELAFRHAARKADHVVDLRRVLHRLLAVLDDWEREADTGE